MRRKALFLYVFLVCNAMRAQSVPVRKYFEDLKILTKNTLASDVQAQQQAAGIVQEAFNSFYFMPQGEATVSSMMEHYHKIYDKSPFLEPTNEQIKLLKQKIEEARQALQHILSESEKFLKERKASGELDQWRALRKEKMVIDKKLVALQKKYRAVRKKFMQKKSDDPRREELRQLFMQTTQLQKEVDDLDKELKICRQELREEEEYYGTVPWKD